MKQFTEISPADMGGNVFDTIGRDWMLITAAADGKVNTMTASWGGMGVLWGSDVVYIFVRRSRYTKEFIDASDRFSISLPDHGKYRDQLAYLGRVSGRDEDKISSAGLTVRYEDGVPFFDESRIAVICEKIARVPITTGEMLDPAIVEKWYADGDEHDMYVGRIVKVLREV